MGAGVPFHVPWGRRASGVSRVTCGLPIRTRFISSSLTARTAVRHPPCSDRLRLVLPLGSERSEQKVCLDCLPMGLTGPHISRRAHKTHGALAANRSGGAADAKLKQHAWAWEALLYVENAFIALARIRST